MLNWTRRVVAISAAGLFVGGAQAGVGDELFKLLASDGAASDQFGVRVGISGTTAIAGAVGNESAYLYNTTTGLELFQLLASDGAPGDRFGEFVAIDGANAIVGARFDDVSGVVSGSAYLFDVATGMESFKLLATGGAANDQFGTAVGISGAVAIVGATGDDEKGSGAGAAFLYDTATGLQFDKLLASDGVANDAFGFSVGVSGTIAIAGSPVNRAAYLFDTTTGLELFKLVALDGAIGDEFGISVAICGTTAIVGSWRDDDNGSSSGSAYLFDATTGQQLFKLIPDDGALNHFFGEVVSINETTAIVSTRANSAYLFDIATGQQLIKLLASDGSAGDQFGFSVGIDGDTAIVGAVGDADNGSNSGSAYLFSAPQCPTDLNGDGVIDTADLGILLGEFGTAGPGADINCDGVVDTADLGILLGAFGASCP